jgi:membrane peptidoglycan carboxypeptidase
MPCRTGSHPPVTAVGVCHGAYPVSVLTSGPFGKFGVAGRLASLSVAGGVLAAALVLPAVGVTGIVVRNGANKFNTLSTPELGQLPVRSQILDDEGNVLAYYYPRGIDRVPVTFQQIAPVMRTAIVAIEDSRFYQHGAIDVKGTIRAFVNDLEHKPIQGGSTLAQQYVKNVLILSSADPQAEFNSAAEDTLSRKIRELRMAVEVEHRMTKDQLLAGYLNVAYFGNQSYGIQVAAQHYFDVPASKLTLPQAALLAGMVENPALYDPSLHPVQSEDRRNVVLGRMAQLRDITQAQAKQAEASPIDLHVAQQPTGCTSASAAYGAYFCDYTLAVMQYDAAYSKAWNQLQGKGGLTIYTTLDPKDQRAADDAVNYMLPPPPSADNPGADAAAEVLIQPGTGYVRAIANDRPYGNGAVDYAVDSEYNGGPDGVQTGSSSKLFTLATPRPCPPRRRSPGTPAVPARQPVMARPARAATRWSTTRPVRRAPTRCTWPPPSRSTSTSPNWRRRSACATWSRWRPASGTTG